MRSTKRESDMFRQCQLAIIHCAGHHDPLLVQKLWRELLNQEINSTKELPQVREVILFLTINVLSLTAKCHSLHADIDLIRYVSSSIQKKIPGPIRRSPAIYKFVFEIHF